MPRVESSFFLLVDVACDQAMVGASHSEREKFEVFSGLIVQTTQKVVFIGDDYAEKIRQYFAEEAIPTVLISGLML